jgi:hypothetical protein
LVKFVVVVVAVEKAVEAFEGIEESYRTAIGKWISFERRGMTELRCGAMVMESTRLVVWLQGMIFQTMSILEIGRNAENWGI